MKILRLQPLYDTPARYNYQVNYGLWDAIAKITHVETHALEHFNGDLNNFDAVLLPMFKRWGNYDLLNRIKESKIKSFLFDNDSCYRSFNHPFYDGIDYIFYRCNDKDDTTPKTPSSLLLWSVNHTLYSPKYGGKGISFNCSVTETYKLRRQIAQIIPPTSFKGTDYISHLQNSAGAIHTNSQLAKVPRAKLLEFAACGTEIISNKIDGMDAYFPDESIIYFDDLSAFSEIIKNYEVNIKNQQFLRGWFEQYHSDETRAIEVFKIISNI